MEILYLVLALVWSILCLILFFKIWVMTNDVAIIKDFLLKSLTSTKTEEPRIPKEVSASYKFKAGDIVKHDSHDKEMRIYKINSDGTCICLDDKTDIMVGTFSVEDLKLMEEYKKK